MQPIIYFNSMKDDCNRKLILNDKRAIIYKSSLFLCFKNVFEKN